MSKDHYQNGFSDKYGGTSVVTAEQDNAIIDRTVKKHFKVSNEGYSILVTSGMGKVGPGDDGRKCTDLMIDISKGIRATHNWNLVKGRLEKKIFDHQIPEERINPNIHRIERILSSGGTIGEAEKAHLVGFPELIQAEILYHVGRNKFPDKKWHLVTTPFGLIGEDSSNRTNVPINHQASLKNIREIARRNSLQSKITIVPGFLGSVSLDNLDQLITLERGSSDATAAYFAAALGLDEVVIHSDKPGILPIHPDVVSDLNPLNELTYLEAHLYAGWGAGIIQQVAIKPVREENIPLIIKSSLEPNKPGTRIGGRPYVNNFGVKAIAYVPNLSAVVVKDITDRPGSGASVEKIFGDYGISVHYLADGTDQRAHIIDPNTDNLGSMLTELNNQHHRYVVSGPLTRVALVGAGMDLAARLGGAEHATEILTNTLRRTRIKTSYRTLFSEDASHSVFVDGNQGERLVKELARDLGMINGRYK